MQKNTENSIRRSHNGLLIISLLGIILGIHCAMLTFLSPTPSYDELSDKTILVNAFGYRSRYRGGGDYYIDSADGSRYLLNGSFSPEELEERLLPGTEISIKWYRYRNGTQYVKEIIYDMYTLSSYSNDDPKDIIICFAMGGFVISLGVAGLVCRRRFIRKELAAAQKKTG